MPPRRFVTFVVLVALSLITVFHLSASSRRVASNAAQAVHVPEIVQAKLPVLDDFSFGFSWYNTAHKKPPQQKNSTSGDTSWYSDWKWLNPFSSSLTLDEDRAVLPPSPPRTPIYTYYDTTVEKTKAQKAADNELLITWRRAWWAQGFKPVVLTQAEATSNPLYRQLQVQAPSVKMEFEVARWLAWEQMGTGILATWLCFPMAAFEDPLLVHLRHGEFERLTRFKELGSGLFAGEKSQITRALQQALNSGKLVEHEDIVSVIEPSHFKVENAASLAHYDEKTIASKYVKVWKLLQENNGEGTTELNQLVRSHLHSTWQNTFQDGIAVLKPLPAHTSKLIEPGQHLARLLSECSTSLLPSSCPPNKPRCSPCVGAKMRVHVAESFRNTSSMFAIATIPHPFTLISLNNQSLTVDVAHIRRRTDRDPWIRSVTRGFLGDGRGGPSRVVALKEIVASEHSRSRGLWFTVEHFPAGLTVQPGQPEVPSNDVHAKEDIKYPKFPDEWLEELDWHVGFPLPRSVVTDQQSQTPVPGAKPLSFERFERVKSSYDPPPPTFEEEQKEVEILDTSRKAINSKEVGLKTMRDISEAWNLADTEIWKFARAFRAKSIVERKQWEEEESAYSRPGVSRSGRWW